MLKSSIKVATVWGIPIYLHASLLIAVVVCYRAFAAQTGNWITALALAIPVEAGLILSIVLHELGHSLVAIRKGCAVQQITLMVVGGVAQMERIPRRPRDELQMAIAGPAVSLVLGIVFLAAFLVTPADPTRPGLFNVLSEVLIVLCSVNIGLAIFNLLPAFPMDGGRMLRAGLAMRMGRLRATYIASKIGQAIVIGLGIFALFHGAVLLALICGFIFFAAGNEFRMERMREMARAAAFGAKDYDPFNQPAGDDEVVISPPPYERRGNLQRSELRPDEPDIQPFD